MAPERAHLPADTLRSSRHAEAAPGRRATRPALESNQALLRAATAPLQAKLTVSDPGDTYEREADTVASTLMRSGAAAGPIHRMPPAELGRAEDRKAEDEEEKKEKDEKKKKEEGEGLQAKRAPGAGPEVTPAIESDVEARRGGGMPLPTGLRDYFEPRLGHDLGHVRVHTDAGADSLARAVTAHAVTSRGDIFFAPGTYQPGTDDGRALLAHELVHTVQQAPGSSLSPARAIEGTSVATPSPSPAGVLARQEAEPAPEPAPPPPVETVTTAPPDAAPPAVPTEPPPDVIPLAGRADFVPTPAVAAWIGAQPRRTADVHVAFADLARGDIDVRVDRDGNYETPRLQAIPFVHPALERARAEGLDAVLAIEIASGKVSGFVTLGTKRGPLSGKNQITEWMKKNPTAMGWVGLDQLELPGVENALEGGTLTVRVPAMKFRIGKFLKGQARFGLENDQVTFDASAAVRVKGIADADVRVQRQDDGTLEMHGEIGVKIANFSGNVIVNAVEGVVDIEGRVRYTTEKLTGEITLLVADAQTARNVALERLGPEAVLAAAGETKGEPAGGKAPRDGERALAGYGTLDFQLTEWLTGQTQVIVDSEGHITLVGKIAPPAQIDLLPPPGQRDYVKELPRLEARAIYGVPIVGNVFVFANVGIDALAKFGPARIHSILIQGRYSTDPQILNEFSIQGTLTISAFAGLRLRGEGGAGLEIIDHDIKIGVGISAIAGIRGYVEATPTIGYREKADPVEGKKGEAYLKGHMELAAQPFLGLGGDLFVELDSPWWSPAPDKKWTWPLGELEYPLPGEFGIGADVEYLIGSPELPEIQFGEVDFNAQKFMTDLMNDHVAPKAAADEEKKGEWTDGTTTGEAAEPALVDTAGAPPEGEAAAGQQTPEEAEAVPSPEIAERWLEGLRALGELAQASEDDALTEAEIDEALAEIKEEYGFTELRAEPIGENWGVEAAINPRKRSKEPPTPKREGRPPELEDIQTPNLDKLAEDEEGVAFRYVEGYKKYKKDRAKQKKKTQDIRTYVEGRAARKLGKGGEKEWLDAYNEASAFSVKKNTKTIEILGPTGARRVRDRIPDFFEDQTIVGDVKNVNYQSLDPQMKDDVRIARGENVRLSGKDELLEPAKQFDLVVRGPSADDEIGTKVSEPLWDEILDTGGDVYDIFDVVDVEEE
jgi:hypothetical protein